SMNTLWQDIRFAVRMMIKHRAFTGVAVIALALGIGANAMVFALTNAILLKVMPGEHVAQMLFVSNINRLSNQPFFPASYPDFLDWRAQSKSFKELGAANSFQSNISDDVTVPEIHTASRVTANTFSIIGLRPVIGRDFTAADEMPDAPQVLILGNSLWEVR